MMTLTLMMVGAALTAALGIYEAYSRGRGLFGWLVSIAASMIGGIALGVTLPVPVVTLINPAGKEASLYLGFGAVAVGLLLGSYLALWIVNRFR